jgi:hypothetical protein
MSFWYLPNHCGRSNENLLTLVLLSLLLALTTDVRNRRADYRNWLWQVQFQCDCNRHRKEHYGERCSLCLCPCPFVSANSHDGCCRQYRVYIVGKEAEQGLIMHRVSINYSKAKVRKGTLTRIVSWQGTLICISNALVLSVCSRPNTEATKARGQLPN